jgi:hypothetical protein
MNRNLTYLTLGILIGYLSPYLIALIKKPQSVPVKQNNLETETNES